MYMIPQEAADGQPSGRSLLGLPPRMEELAELLLKREILRMLYKELKPRADEENICLRLHDIEHAASILDRWIEIGITRVRWGLVK